VPVDFLVRERQSSFLIAQKLQTSLHKKIHEGTQQAQLSKAWHG
jgi:hypothetical protein